jgi:hypothetical protein
VELTSASLNIDYHPSSNIIFRIEGRWMNNKDGFIKSKVNSYEGNYIIATSIAIKLAKTRKIVSTINKAINSSSKRAIVITSILS